MAQSKLQNALDAYEQGLRIRQTLAEQDKSNSGWQRDLAVSYMMLTSLASPWRRNSSLRFLSQRP